MRLGLGTGSTVAVFLPLLAEKVRAGLDVVAVPTSRSDRPAGRHARHPAGDARRTSRRSTSPSTAPTRSTPSSTSSRAAAARCCARRSLPRTRGAWWSSPIGRSRWRCLAPSRCPSRSSPSAPTPPCAASPLRWRSGPPTVRSACAARTASPSSPTMAIFLPTAVSAPSPTRLRWPVPLPTIAGRRRSWPLSRHGALRLSSAPRDGVDRILHA